VGVFAQSIPVAKTAHSNWSPIQILNVASYCSLDCTMKHQNGRKKEGEMMFV
jgi:hypothetical protein